MYVRAFKLVKRNLRIKTCDLSMEPLNYKKDMSKNITDKRLTLIYLLHQVVLITNITF